MKNKKTSLVVLVLALLVSTCSSEVCVALVDESSFQAASFINIMNAVGAGSQLMDLRARASEAHLCLR